MMMMVTVFLMLMRISMEMVWPMQLMKMMMVTAFLMMKIRMMMEMARRMNSKLFQFYLYACPKIPDLLFVNQQTYFCLIYFIGRKYTLCHLFLCSLRIKDESQYNNNLHPVDAEDCRCRYVIIVRSGYTDNNISTI